MGSRVNGLALAVVAAGSVLLYAGIKGISVGAALQSIVRGKSPKGLPVVNPITGGDFGGGGGSAPGGPLHVSGDGGISPRTAYVALRQAGFPVSAAIMLTAIGGVESSWNVNAVNNTPATGDLSIGVWQINYYGDLLGPRTAEFGGPQELLGNLQKQAHAAFVLWSQDGFGPWQPDITSGKINAFWAQAVAASRGGD